jgi:myo-inositol-1(or 4)-monophosphatase
MDDFLRAAEQAAEAGGEIIRRSWPRPREVRHKSAIDLVTPADLASEKAILAVLCERFPAHAIVAEEQAPIAGASPYRWIVDPLDGTTNFAHGYPQVSVSIALEHEGRIVLGLVYDPLRGERFHALEARGAYLNGAPIRVSSVPTLEGALLGTGFPYDRRDFPDFYLAFFKRFMLSSQGIRRSGSAALDLCYVACGRLDGFWEWKLHAWDTAAGSLIVREAGGTVTDFSGRPFSPWQEQTLASNGLIHGEMVRALQETLALTRP